MKPINIFNFSCSITLSLYYLKMSDHITVQANVTGNNPIKHKLWDSLHINSDVIITSQSLNYCRSLHMQLLPSVCGNSATKATKHEGTSITHHEPSAWYVCHFTALYFHKNFTIKPIYSHTYIITNSLMLVWDLEFSQQSTL